jgi:hypothetical protein
MTAHELARHLLLQPDYAVIMNGWGSNEGIEVEVVGSQVIDTPKETTSGKVERKEIHLLHEEVKW